MYEAMGTTGRTRMVRRSFPAIAPEMATALGRPTNAFSCLDLQEEVEMMYDHGRPNEPRKTTTWRFVERTICD